MTTIDPKRLCAVRLINDEREEVVTVIVRKGDTHALWVNRGPDVMIIGAEGLFEREPDKELVVRDLPAVIRRDMGLKIDLTAVLPT